MKTASNKPAPPPGLPTIDQRIAAIQLATRSHSSSSSSSSSKNKKMSGHALVLPEDPKDKPLITKLPDTISFPTNSMHVIVEEGAQESEMVKPVPTKRHFWKKSQRPRFLRGGKTAKLYQRVEPGTTSIHHGGTTNDMGMDSGHKIPSGSLY